MKPFDSPIPKQPKVKDRKRCYTVWNLLNNTRWKAGGKVVWLTDKQLTFYKIKYTNRFFEEVIDKDTKELYKKYLHQTVD